MSASANQHRLLPIVLNVLIFSLVLIGQCWGPPGPPPEPSVPLWGHVTRWAVVGCVITYGFFKTRR